VSTTTWRRVEALFEQALAQPVDEREQWLDRACGDDQDLRDEVVSLLASDAEAGTRLERVVDASAADTAGRSAAAPSDHERLGRTLGPWRLESLVGAGGMGVVYAAVRADDAFQKRVAVKLVRASAATPEATGRFRRERQALAQLDHPHIAHLLDGGTTEEGTPYLVMDYVEGDRIDRWCDDRKLELNDRLRLFRHVCDAVHHAHQNLVVHRDIKPGNVLVTPEGEPKLLDFGIAKILEHGAPAAATRDQLLTPEYASPEQLRGEPITTASDIYSLGVLLFELLTGRRPFEAGTRPTHEVMRSICDDDAPAASEVVTRDADEDLAGELATRRGQRPDTLRRALAGDLDTILAVALHKDPARRYPSAQALSDDLHRHLEGLTVSARKDTLRYRVAKFTRRNRVAVAVAVLVALAIGASLWGLATTLASEREQASQKQSLLTAALGLLRTNTNFVRSGTEFQQLAQVLDQLEGVVRAVSFDSVEEELAVLEAIDSGYDRLRLGHKIPWVLPRMVEVVELLEPRDPVREARMLRRVGRVDEALALQREHLEEPHLEIALSLASKAARLQRIELVQAEPALDEALEMALAATDGPDLEVAYMLRAKASLLHRLARNDEALEFVDQALVMAQALQPREPYSEGSIRDIRGWLLQDMGRYDEALVELRKSEALFSSVLLPDHPRVHDARRDLGLLLKDMGRFEEAEDVLVAAQAGMEAVYGSSVSVQRYGTSLAKLYADWGRWEEALDYARESYAAHMQTLGREHSSTSEIATLFARTLLHNGRPEEALPMVEQSFETRERLMPMERWERHKTRSVLGCCYARLGRFEEAEPLLLNSYPWIRDDRGVGHKRTVQACERIIELYELWGKPDEAARWRAELPEGATLTHLPY
jgi:serine/threonine-protein kinase